MGYPKRALYARRFLRLISPSAKPALAHQPDKTASVRPALGPILLGRAKAVATNGFDAISRPKTEGWNGRKCASDRAKKLFQFLNVIGARALRIQLGRVLEMAKIIARQTNLRKENRRAVWKAARVGIGAACSVHIRVTGGKASGGKLPAMSRMKEAAN
jgi:hypothetical protein